MPLTKDSARRKDARTFSGSPQLQHRHFAFIAGVLARLPKDTISIPARLRVIEAFADACAQTNPNFDYDRFIEAATQPME